MMLTGKQRGMTAEKVNLQFIVSSKLLCFPPSCISDFVRDEG